MRERLRDYELMIVISPLRSSEEDVNATLTRIQQSLASVGGELTSSDFSAPWGRRKMAYPIRRYAEGEASRRSFNEGFYVLLRFTLATAQITEFERQLKLNDAVIRYLITLVDQRGQQPLADGAAIEPLIDGEGSEEDGEDEA